MRMDNEKEPHSKEVIGGPEPDDVEYEVKLVDEPAMASDAGPTTCRTSVLTC